MKSHQRGIALLIVLTSLVLLSSAVIEFVYQENVVSSISENERDRVQAYFLANSALIFAKVVIKYDKEVKSMADSAQKKYNTNFVVPPLYEIVPINTALFRQMMLFGGSTATEGSEGGTGEEGGSEGESGSLLDKKIGILDSKGLEDFLNFDGDFSAKIEDEESKLNINAFNKYQGKQKEYLRLKNILTALLLSDEFKSYFDNRVKDATELAGNIADFIDADEVAQGPKGEEGGAERSRYKGKIRPKNERLLSLEELVQVDGMKPEILVKLKDYLTLYGKDDKIVACHAKDELIRAMVLAYTEDNAQVERISVDNEELLDKAVLAVKAGCPKAQAMATNLNQVLGVSATTSTVSTSTTGVSDPAAVAGVTSFSSMIADQSSFFSIVAKGTIGNDEEHQSVVNIRTVYDTSDASPVRWKLLYWRVE